MSGLTSRRSVTWTPEKRAALSRKMKRRMADPATRALISERTKAGMLANAGTHEALWALRAAWAAAVPATRARFLSELALALSAPPAPIAEDR